MKRLYSSICYYAFIAYDLALSIWSRYESKVWITIYDVYSVSSWMIIIQRMSNTCPNLVQNTSNQVSSGDLLASCKRPQRVRKESNFEKIVTILPRFAISSSDFILICASFIQILYLRCSFRVNFIINPLSSKDNHLNQQNNNVF